MNSIGVYWFIIMNLYIMREIQNNSVATNPAQITMAFPLQLCSFVYLEM